MMSYRAIEAGGFGNMPRSVRRQGPPRESERKRPYCEPATPALYAARDGKLIGMLTGRGGGVGRVTPQSDF